jgi:hypothetical protein
MKRHTDPEHTGELHCLTIMEGRTYLLCKTVCNNYAMELLDSKSLKLRRPNQPPLIHTTLAPTPHQAKGRAPSFIIRVIYDNIYMCIYIYICYHTYIQDTYIYISYHRRDNPLLYRGANAYTRITSCAIPAPCFSSVIYASSSWPSASAWPSASSWPSASADGPGRGAPAEPGAGRGDGPGETPAGPQGAPGGRRNIYFNKHRFR